MRRTGRRSTNYEDRSGATGPRMAGGGGLLVLMRILPFLLRSKIGRILLLVAVVGFFGAKMLGIDLLPMLTGGSGVVSSDGRRAASPEEDELEGFILEVLADTEETWQQQFQKMGLNYKEPGLVRFSGSVSSACGYAQAAMGPFYCPADQKMYIDLSFYRDLRERHNAPGDLAQAYVLAHEVGHHVQTLLGISGKVHSLSQGASKAEANALSVRQELQADCLAGLWAYSAHQERQLLDEGDLEEALQAAAAIGDDRLQEQARGKVVPESFTHGTSAQRAHWFKRGFKTGDFESCDTFAAAKI